ncbi:MAG: hypothetical protein CMJ68_05750 [Planctomycetaceae bacterium]|nr:hypothetical protein [Planctomycetaceae bacterium]|tara:strand:+ start:2155 stop:2532 length:378 start_codon:yes stop_codon:yes gene_type:complete
MELEGFNSQFFQAEAIDHCVVLRFHAGPLNEESNIEELGRSLFQLIDQHGCHRIAIDLSETSFITSSVLGKLISLHRRLHRSSGRLVLFGLQAPVESVMRRSNLYEYFRITECLETGLAWLDSTE